MIYAEMPMKDLPKSCKSCLLSEKVHGIRRCIVTGEHQEIVGRRLIKLKNCPLVKVEKD